MRQARGIKFLKKIQRHSNHVHRVLSHSGRIFSKKDCSKVLCLEKECLSLSPALNAKLDFEIGSVNRF